LGLLCRGDRVAQTVDGTLTTYILDTATPLTMVLAETTGTDTIYYLHGLDLVAQSDGATTEYFGYDGLGSVRQMLDESGGARLTQTYDPYGSVYAAAGPGATHYGFAGEQVDASRLIYLRARYYSPGMGRFLNADPSRQERNPYQYGGANPIMLVDPSGYISEGDEDGNGTLDAEDADEIREWLRTRYGITIERDYGWEMEWSIGCFGACALETIFDNPVIAIRLTNCDFEWQAGDWTLSNLRNIGAALDAIRAAMLALPGVSFRDADAAMIGVWGGVTVAATERRNGDAIGRGNMVRLGTEIRGSSDDSYQQYWTVHEFGHVWDERSWFALSGALAELVGRRSRNCGGYSLSDCFESGEVPPGFDEIVDPSRQNYAARGRWFYPARLDDFAESFASYVVPGYNPGYGGWTNTVTSDSLRYRYIRLQLFHIATTHDPSTIADNSSFLPVAHGH